MIIFEKDGAGLMREDGVLWLFVRDGNGMHSTSLTDETRVLLAQHLRGWPSEPEVRRYSDDPVRFGVTHAERERQERKKR